MLPLLGGLVAGAIPADRIARILGAELTVAGGFAALGARLAVGSSTSLGSSGAFVAAWMAVVGARMGLALATAVQPGGLLLGLGARLREFY